MNALKNDFGQRIPTPMQVLNPHLEKFLVIPTIKKVVLNRQSYKLKVVGDYDPETYVRKPVTFDCVYVYKLGNTGASFSFSFNFKDLQAEQQTVRATVKVKETAGIEYSKECSVHEMKSLLKSYLDAQGNIEQAFNPAQAQKFISEFAEAFGIILSRNLDPSQVKQFKAEYVAKVQGLNGKLKKCREDYEKLKKKGSSLTSSEHELMDKLVGESILHAKELNHVLREGGKDLPAQAREHAMKELKIDTSYLH